MARVDARHRTALPTTHTFVHRCNEPSCIYAKATKKEVNSIMRCRQMKTDARPPGTCAENVIKFENMIFDIRHRADRQIFIQTR